MDKKCTNKVLTIEELVDIEQSFLAHIELHKGILYKLSKLYMDNEEDRADLFQEMIFQLWSSYSTFEGKSLFSTWMYRVALNTALVFVKNDKKKLKSEELTDRIDAVEYSDHQQKEEQLAYFYQAVHELNDIEKALIFLFLEGQSHRDIGLQLGISEGNARVRLNRTKDKLQDIIKRQGYEF